MVMAPIKFEEHMKEALGNRKLDPSKDGWSKLSARLDAEENKKKPIWLWMAVAAGIAGFIFIATTVFNTEAISTTPDANFVDVNDNFKMDTKNETLDVTNVVKQNDEVVPDTKTSVVENDSVEPVKENPLLVEASSKVESPQKAIQQTVEKFVNPTIKEATIVTKQAKNTSVESDKSNLPQAEISKEIQDAMAAIEIKKQNDEVVTDAYIDSLIQSAYANITTKKESLINQNGTLNASSLLAEVELDLEKSFRDKVFEALKSGFQEVRTAVVNRNQ